MVVLGNVIKPQGLEPLQFPTKFRAPSINARHEWASTVLTSNKGFEEWGHVLGDEVMAAALIDRLLHHCHIVNIRGNSYRMREHQHWLRTASDEQREGVAT